MVHMCTVFTPLEPNESVSFAQVESTGKDEMEARRESKEGRKEGRKTIRRIKLFEQSRADHVAFAYN